MRSIDREILRLSLPTIVSNVTVPLLGICDTAISGHLGSDLFLSAIAVASVMLNVVFWIFGFLRGGTTGLTANALGASNAKEIARVFYRSIFIGVSAGMLLILFQVPVFGFLWWITGSGPEIREFVEEYFSIRIWGSPALLATMAISGWFVGMQSTFYPMLIAIISNVINIGASFFLAFPLGAGFQGVAMGTLIANWLGLGVALGCVVFFCRRAGTVNPLSATFNFRHLLHGTWSRYFTVNGNLFLRSFFIICVTMGVTAAGARLGNLTLAVNVIIMQFFQFFSFFIDGFAFSGEAMVGLRYGSKDFLMLRKSVRRLLQWTLFLGISFSLLYWVGLESVATLLTDSESVVAGVSEMTLWVALIPIFSCWAFIYDGFYIGVTDTFRMMLSTLIGGGIFFAIIIFNQSMGAQGSNSLIWIAFLSYLSARGLFLALFWQKNLVHASA